MNMEAISKDRNFQEHILMINGMKIMLLMQILIIAIYLNQNLL